MSPLALVMPLSFLLWGALIWFGFDRTWVESRLPLNYVTPMVPWASITFNVVLLAGSLGLSGPPYDGVVRAIAVSSAVLAIGAGLFRYPRWAVPPWYWKLKELDERYERGEISAMEHWRESRSPLDKLLRRR